MKRILIATLSFGFVPRLFPSLCLAVLAVFLLSSASPANAQSVIGGVVIKQGYFREIPITSSVSARTGSAGP